MVGGVIQKAVEGMGASDDVCLWLVTSLAKFPPKARKRKNKKRKQQNKSMGALNLQILSAF